MPLNSDEALATLEKYRDHIERALRGSEVTFEGIAQACLAGELMLLEFDDPDGLLVFTVENVGNVPAMNIIVGCAARPGYGLDRWLERVEHVASMCGLHYVVFKTFRRGLVRKMDEKISKGWKKSTIYVKRVACAKPSALVVESSPRMH